MPCCSLCCFRLSLVGTANCGRSILSQLCVPLSVSTLLKVPRPWWSSAHFLAKLQVLLPAMWTGHLSCHCSDVNPHNIQGSCRGWIFLARCTSATREIRSSKCPSCTHSLQPLLWCTVLNGIYNHKTVLAVSYRVPVSLGLDFHFLYYITVMVGCCMEASFCLLCCTAFLWQPSLLHQWQTSR